MTEKFVTLPREVVEQVLEALIYCEAPDSSSEDQRFQAAIALRAALEQPQAVTNCHQLEQPQVEQEPYAWHYKNNGGASVWHTGPSNRLDADIEAAKSYPKVHQVTPLYLHPQPKREPLTESAIADIVIDMNGNEPTALFWRDLSRAIEAAHNIK